MYSINRPPIVKSNLGSTPWPTVLVDRPWIEYVVIQDSSGTYTQGTALTLTGTNPHLLVQIGGTSQWIHALANFWTVPDANMELAYYVSAGQSGEVVDEGTIFISSTDSVISTTEFAKVDIAMLSSMEIPASVAGTKTYPIQVVPKSLTGEVISLTGSSGSVTITITRLSDSTAIATNAAFTLDSGVYSYNWQLTYGLPPSVHSVQIRVNLDNSGTNFKDFFLVVETYKRNEASMVRGKSGSFISS